MFSASDVPLTIIYTFVLRYLRLTGVADQTPSILTSEIEEIIKGILRREDQGKQSYALYPLRDLPVSALDRPETLFDYPQLTISLYSVRSYLRPHSQY